MDDKNPDPLGGQDNPWRRKLLLGTLAGGITLAANRSKAHELRVQENIIQPPSLDAKSYMVRAQRMRDLATLHGDQAYGAIVVAPTGRIVGQAPSRVVQRMDPSAHAEMEAIRDAARRLGKRDLSGHRLYSTSRPCPMCEAAAYWANIAAMIHGTEATNAGRPRLCG